MRRAEAPPGGSWRARVAAQIADIDETAWDTRADQASASANPFLRHRFLRALEESGCVAPRTGWTPHHVVIEDSAGALLAAAPTYQKTHSQGEYIFDHGWAEAYETAGGRYYPKLLVGVPFSPVPGPRLLAASDAARGLLLDALVAETGAIGASSLHVNFCREDEWTFLGEKKLAQRTGEQFHWHNRGYDSFEAFLGDLASRKRKAVRKERAVAAAGGAITFRTLQGADIEERHWDAFFAFYLDTGSRKWGRPYLNRRFFSLLGEAMADQVVLILAYRGTTPIAGALNLAGPDCLYGRYWGCTEYHPALHFEVCYYQAIDYAIAHKLGRVEAGAQGPHKLARGYLPARTYSAHYLADPALRRAVEQYLVKERAYVESEMRELDEHSPFRQSQDEQD